MSGVQPPTWVLLRGLTREQAHWGPFGSMLARALPGTTVAAVDLPGAGLLHRQASPIRVDAMVAACRDQLQQQGLAPPYALLALSLGGMVATQWASQAPEDVARLVLVNTSMRPLSPLTQRLRPGNWAALAGLLVARDRLAIERTVLRLTSRRPATHADAPATWAAIRQARPVSTGNALRQLLAAARYRLPAARPATPALVVASRGDGLVDPRCSRALARHWQAPLVEHDWAGHDLPLDAGPWLAAQVARWVLSTGGP